MVTFSHTDEGTNEAAWAASGLPAAPGLPLGPDELAALRFVVLAAHPDDETLGAGGLLASLQAMGAAVEVLLCTAGEGSHPDSPSCTPEELADVRIREFSEAMAALGLQGRWRFLGLPDKGLAMHAGTIAAAIREAGHRLPGWPGGLVLVAPYRADGHADHDALGTVSAEVARQDGHGLLEYPIWYWLWATPDHADWQAWWQFPLDEQARTAKGAALQAHASQVRPLSPAEGDEALLGEGFLRHFTRGYEMFAWTPPQETAAGPHRSTDAERVFDGVHGRSEDPWNYTSSWYERRKRALTLAALPAETYESGLEVGCSIGTLTAELAGRCRNLMAVDASGTALTLAGRRLAGLPHVGLRRLVVPEAWPEGRFDLVVVSEVGYYLAADELSTLWDRIEACLEPGGTLLLCHWRHPVDGWELDGDAVHAAARERPGWQPAGLYRERDFVLETLVAPGRPRPADRR